MIDRQASYHRSFVAMRNALRSILFHNGDCERKYEPKASADELCECPVCIAKAALANEEDWRFLGWNPERRFSSPRELAIANAWQHYFKRTGGPADGTSRPVDAMLAKVLGVDTDSVSERDWYVATTVVQWLATNVGQCILFDAGYEHRTKEEREGDRDRTASASKFERVRALAGELGKTITPEQVARLREVIDMTQTLLFMEIMDVIQVAR